jgi:S-methylmethionine-dependent homocysteine/selenocysteine methylase
MKPDEAESYHTQQIKALAEAGADAILYSTGTYVDEAIGVVKAARRAEIPGIHQKVIRTSVRISLPVSTTCQLSTLRYFPES